MVPEALDLLIYGAGGHGLVVAELAQLLGYRSIGLFDDNRPYMDLPEGLHFLGSYNSAKSPETPLVIAIGSNTIRMKLAANVSHRFATLVHPRAVVAGSVKLGVGTVVLAGVIVQSNVSIGMHNIMNAGVVVDHDVQTGHGVHIRPQAYIGSHASLSDGVTIAPCQVVERFCRL